MSMTQELEIKALKKLVSELGEQKMKAMTLVESLSRTNKRLLFKLRILQDAMKKLEFCFQKILTWDESEQCQSASSAAIEYITRLLKDAK